MQVRAALDTGAKGFILKVDAGSELPRAIEAVLQGEQMSAADWLTAWMQTDVSRFL